MLLNLSISLDILAAWVLHVSCVLRVCDVAIELAVLLLIFECGNLFISEF